MFLLDANVFIEAARTYYAPSLAPTFWSWLTQRHQGGTVASIEAVRDELVAGQDPLAAWARGLPTGFWLAPDQAAVTSMGNLSTWAMSPQRGYTQAARSEFLAAADYLLVAQAHSGGHELVTREQPRPESKKRVMIPDACDAMGVPWRDPFEVYHQLGLVM